MAKVSNLRQFRKRKAREDAAARAAENRVRHGRTPAQRQQESEEQARTRRLFEQHRRETTEDDD